MWHPDLQHDTSCGKMEPEAKIHLLNSTYPLPHGSPKLCLRLVQVTLFPNLYKQRLRKIKVKLRSHVSLVSSPVFSGILEYPQLNSLHVESRDFWDLCGWEKHSCKGMAVGLQYYTEHMANYQKSDHARLSQDGCMCVSLRETATDFSLVLIL